MHTNMHATHTHAHAHTHTHTVLWTAQGQILIQNSSKEKMATTSGLFWFMLESRSVAYMELLSRAHVLLLLLFTRVPNSTLGPRYGHTAHM